MEKKNNFYKLFKIISLSATLVIIGIGYTLKNLSEKRIIKANITLRDIAYEVTKAYGYTIYLEESQILVPYLVLTADYEGKALLLRRDILEIACPFDKTGSNYYKGSTVDAFLKQFFSSYSPEVQTLIIDSTITITQNIPNWDKTESIMRKVFLLSCTEVQIGTGLHTEEGTSLVYFAKKENYKAKQGNKAVSWGLRSTYTGSTGLVWTIGSDGTVGGSGVQLTMGIRPAICMGADTEIQLIEKEGKKIYILKEN